VQSIDSRLIEGFDGDRDDVFVAGSFQEGFGVGSIGLVSLTVSGHMGGWKERDLVTEALELASPVVSGATGLHEDVSRWVMRLEASA
jgi:hypothetical protein